jgi:membrane protease YdiL (CAAX protease family)
MSGEATPQTGSQIGSQDGTQTGTQGGLTEVGAPAGPDPWHHLNGQRPSSRLPHLGHALLFLALTLLLLFLAELILSTLSSPALKTTAVTQGIQPKRQLAAQAAVYIAALGSSFLIFPLLWGRGFLAGINWNGGKALKQMPRLIPLGLAVGLAVQALSSLIPAPKSIPMDDFFRTPSDVWLVALFGTLLAPLFEEISFRGFLLPAFAIAFDWLHPMLRYLVAFTRARLAGDEPPRHIAAFPEDAAAGLDASTGNLLFRSATAIVAASILSSVLFARLHSDQIAHSWGGLSVLFCVSLVLTAIRVRSKSVACSTMVHASYNLSVFITIFLATGGFRHLDRLGK